MSSSKNRTLCVSNPFLGTIKPSPVEGLIVLTDEQTDKNTPIHPLIKSLMATKTPDILPYKLAKIHAGDKEQFIFYSYWSKIHNKYIRQKVRAAARGAKISKPDRMTILNASLKEINNEFKRRNQLGIYHEDIVGAVGVKAYIFYVNNIIETAKLPDSSRRTLRSYHSAFVRFQVHSQKTFTPLNVDAQVMDSFKQFLQAEGKANKTINEYLWAAQVVSEALAKKGVIPKAQNLSDHHVKKIKNQTLKYRPLTHQEKDAIFNHARQTNPSFYLYLLHIYYTCIRLSEAKRLLIKHYDLTGRKITVPWYSAKNGLTNHVQILEPLGEALKDMNIKNNPASHYIFGKKFAVGPHQYTGKNDSDIWRRECKKIGLSDDAMMYALKHTFNVDYVENNINNINWEWLRRHNRHATIQQTQEYIYSMIPHFLDETQSKILNYYNAL